MEPVQVPDFANLTIEISRVLLSSSRVDETNDPTPPDPFVRIYVSEVMEAVTRAHQDSREPQFDESFSFGSVASDTPLTLAVYDADDHFHDMIGFYGTTPADVVRNGWSGQLHFYTLSDSSEGILANITFA